MKTTTSIIANQPAIASASSLRSPNTFLALVVAAVGITSAVGQDIASPCYKSPANPFASAGWTGQCTWFAFGRAFEKTGVAVSFRGNGGTWTTNQGYGTGATPKADSIISWTGGGYGHVAFVEQVNADDSIVITEANNGANSYYQKYGGQRTTGYPLTLTKMQWSQNIGFLNGYRINNFVYLKPNRPPVITSVSAWASTGTMTVTGATFDPDSDPIMQLDTWIIDASTGAAVSDSIVRSMQGSFIPGSFRISWTPTFLTARIAKSGYYKIALRSLDNRNGKVETTSAPFWYDRPLPSAPEIDILQNGSSRPSGGNASLFRTQVNTTCSATLTIQNPGKSDLKISSWSTTNSSFSASLSTTIIKPGYSGTITVRFTPSTSGYTYGTLAIQNNDADESRYLINLVGYGTR